MLKTVLVRREPRTFFNPGTNFDDLNSAIIRILPCWTFRNFDILSWNANDSKFLKVTASKLYPSSMGCMIGFPQRLACAFHSTLIMRKNCLDNVFDANTWIWYDSRSIQSKKTIHIRIYTFLNTYPYLEMINFLLKNIHHATIHCRRMLWMLSTNVKYANLLLEQSTTFLKSQMRRYVHSVVFMSVVLSIVAWLCIEIRQITCCRMLFLPQPLHLRLDISADASHHALA